MRDRWTLKVRAGAHVHRSRHGSLQEALGALDGAVADISGAARLQAVDLKVRNFTPQQQVAARAELTGPGPLGRRPRGGVDIRGDGSRQAFVGWVQREPIELGASETPMAGLERVLRDRAP